MKEEILVLVKTYPTFSKKYFELVCTAGINKQGEWRRIYPVPFRSLDEEEQYKKYQWIEVDLEKSTDDSRPESRKLQGEINVLDFLPTDNYWIARKEALESIRVYENLDEIIEKAKVKNELSLCRFKPTKILELKVKEVEEREWSENIRQAVERANRQKSLFKDMDRQIKLAKKLPYKFSYSFVDDVGRESTLMISDWEIGQLYWNCLKDANNNEKIACQKVREKYEGFLTKNDITLFLGTTWEYHKRSPNPFIIIGVFYPLKTNQPDLMS